MRTLYITDLDGTLLNSDGDLSEYTKKTINALIDKGMIFSYATARSLTSASIVTKGLKINYPVISYNGTFLINSNTKETLFLLCFNRDETEIVKNAMNKNSIYPLVYSFINGEEKVSWIESKETKGIRSYIDSRKGDSRLRPVENSEQLYKGDIFYFTFIADSKEQLLHISDYLKDKPEYNCLIQKELYKEEYWCEIMLNRATKGNAILALKDILKCDKIISFGDAVNDISMFEASDESYAVENAVDELKEYATEIISSNEEDGVAKWLVKNFIPPVSI